ncbi:hypothetical protein [Microbacterium rhizomatis]|uniref:Uncharacterized protein n=1 Tax=Microbacterium rhizomatis TaxID=1631477 RepID=A0A5J5J5V4_9MICO|nr:hypothetical protein [Microbacterium rhizomatis]KAA9110173.1 hypothetical protein F6B43_00235 [Microbacterium rhizomatis]
MLAAGWIRDAGYRVVVDGPVESAVRAQLGEPNGDAEATRFAMVFTAARILDDPNTNARSIKPAIEAMRFALADAEGDGGANDAAAVMDAIRDAARGGDGSAVGNAA